MDHHHEIRHCELCDAPCDDDRRLCDDCRREFDADDDYPTYDSGEE